MEVTFHTFAEYGEQLQEFFTEYELLRHGFSPEKPPRLKLRSDRICRFCGRRSDPRMFKKEAHVIPNMLGNANWISDFECDSCNTRFSEYETAFSSYLGLIKPLSFIKARNGIKGFRSPDRFVEAKYVKDFFAGPAIKIERKPSDNFSFDVDLETGETKIKYRKPGFRRLDIYKCLLKIALSMLTEGEIVAYKAALAFLQTDFKDDYTTSNAMVHVIRIAGFDRKVPFALLFRRTLSMNVPEHFFMLYFQGFVFQFPLFFNDLDYKSGVITEEMSVPICPPLFPQPVMFEKGKTLSAALENFGSNLVKVEEEVLYFKSQPMKREDMMRIDLGTMKEVSDAVYDPDRIVGIYVKKDISER